MMRMICVSNKDGNLVLVVSVVEYGNVDLSVAGGCGTMSMEILAAIVGRSFDAAPYYIFNYIKKKEVII